MSHSSFDIQHLARLSRLRLTPEETVSYEQQLSRVLDYMSVLERHDLSGVEPTAHAMPVHDVWREDTVAESLPTEQVLANAPKQAAGQILMPRVVEE